MKIKLFNSKIIGLYILFIGFFILIKAVLPDMKIIFFLLTFFIIFSIHLILQILISKKKKKLIVTAVTILLTSLFLLIYFFYLKKFYGVDKIWPILGFFPSIGLIVYYFISNNKSPSSIIPGIFIIILSIILLLMTNNLIQIDFITILVLLLAGMFIFMGLFLIFKKKIEKIKKQLDNKNSNKNNIINQ